MVGKIVKNTLECKKQKWKDEFFEVLLKKPLGTIPAEIVNQNKKFEYFKSDYEYYRNIDSVPEACACAYYKKWALDNDCWDDCMKEMTRVKSMAEKMREENLTNPEFNR